MHTHTNHITRNLHSPTKVQNQIQDLCSACNLWIHLCYYWKSESCIPETRMRNDEDQAYDTQRNCIELPFAETMDLWGCILHKVLWKDLKP
jgi:hypothetical protein